MHIPPFAAQNTLGGAICLTQSNGNRVKPCQNQRHTQRMIVMGTTAAVYTSKKAKDFLPHNTQAPITLWVNSTPAQSWG